MKKESIYVTIKNEAEALRAASILRANNEKIYDMDLLPGFDKLYCFHASERSSILEWGIGFIEDDEQVSINELTLDQFEQFFKDEYFYKAKGIIDMFRPHAYPFAAGSGFMTGEICEETILKGAKKLAAIHAQGIADNIGQDHPKWSFWVGVVDAIKNYSEADPNQLEIDGLKD